MPVETLRPSAGGVSSMPFRLLNKGPAYFRRPLAEPGLRTLSAVERLEADKAKYVKSQRVVLTRQAPIKPPRPSPTTAGPRNTPIIRKPLLTPAMHVATPPARKVPRRPMTVETGAGGGGGGGRGPALNLEILNNLINNVSDVAPNPTSRSSHPSCSSASSSTSSPSSSSPSPSGSSPSSGAKSLGSSLSAEPHLLLNSSSSSTSSPLNNNNNLPPPVPARAPRVATPPYPHPHPHPTAVRRVDVRPHAALRTFSPRPAFPLKPPPRQAAQPQAPPTLPPPPHKTPSSSSSSPSSRQTPQKTPPPPYPPPSPAFTRLSNASSRGSLRKPPALHRSKSDLSDRYSRATADLERFFNYCGLDPGEVEALGGVERFARANSDIVSVSKLRSVSTPSSECDGGGEGGGEEEGEGPARGSERVPYGISVIERNARVIKWLYGIRQARDATHAVSNV